MALALSAWGIAVHGIELSCAHGRKLLAKPLSELGLNPPDTAAIGARQAVEKMSSGRNADTSMFGASTTWLIFRSTATLQMA